MVRIYNISSNWIISYIRFIIRKNRIYCSTSDINFVLCCAINYHNYGIYCYAFCKSTKRKRNEFRILVEKLRGQEEAIKTVKEQVFRIGQNVLISEEKLEDIKEEFKRLKWCELEGLIAEVLSPLLSLLFSLSESPILGK